MTKSHGADVIPFRPSKPATVTSTTASSGSTGSSYSSIARVLTHEGIESQDKLPSIHELYPSSDNRSLILQLQDLASQGLGICKKTIELCIEEQFIEADIEAMRIPNILAEMFCYRDLGDGLANAIDTMQTAMIYHSKHGLLLDLDSAKALEICFETIFDSPGMSFEKSLDISEHLEKCGMSPNIDLGGLIEE